MNEIYTFKSSNIHNKTIAFCIQKKVKNDPMIFEIAMIKYNCVCCAQRNVKISNLYCKSYLHDDKSLVNDLIKQKWSQIESKVYEHIKYPFKLYVIDSTHKIFNSIENGYEHVYVHSDYFTDDSVNTVNIQKTLNKYVPLYWELLRKLNNKNIIISINNILKKLNLPKTQNYVKCLDNFLLNYIDFNNSPILDAYKYIGNIIISENIQNIGRNHFDPYIENFYILNNHIKPIYLSYENEDQLYNLIYDHSFFPILKTKHKASQKDIKLAIKHLRDLYTEVHTIQEIEQLGAFKINGKDVNYILNQMLGETKQLKNPKIYSINDLISNIQNSNIYKLKFKTYENQLLYTAKHNLNSDIINHKHLWSFTSDVLPNHKIYEITHIYPYNHNGYSYFLFITKNNIIKEFKQCLHPDFINLKWLSQFTPIFNKLNIHTQVNIPNSQYLSTGIGICSDSSIEIQINDSKKWINI